MKIVVYEVERWERDKFRDLKDDHDLIFIDTPLTADTNVQHINTEIVSTFIYSELSAETLKNFPFLKMIATRSTGFNHIDMDYCKANNIMVCNVPLYGECTVAEHVFGLLLTISHHLTEAVNRTRRGDFSMQGLRGFDLFGKTLGVVGTGNIGQCVIRIAKGFDMNVVAYDVNPIEDFAFTMGFKYVDFNTLLSGSDIITLHVPAIKETYHLLSHQEFAVMKKGVILINTARGCIIDTHALLNALAEDRVAAVGLDVLPEEPVIREEAELLRSVFQKKHNLEEILAGHVLLRLRNVYITPHSAFNTKEAIQRILDTTVDNIKAFAHGRPHNIVRG